MLYRVKQFMWAIKGNFQEIDYNFIKKYLDDDELELFNRLTKGEQYHCIRVCNDSIKIAKEKNINVNLNLLCKAALLHDIGKIDYHLNVFKKSILVLLHKASKGKLRNFSNIKAVDTYYNHSKNGIKKLDNDKYSKEFLQVISEHHNTKDYNNVLLNIIREADNKN